MRNTGFKSLLFLRRRKGVVPVAMTGQILLEDILTPAYLRRHLGIGDLRALLAAAGVANLEEAKMATLNKIVRARSRFINWEEMLAHASSVYIENKHQRKSDE